MIWSMIWSPSEIEDARTRLQTLIWNEPLSEDALSGLNNILIMLKHHENMNRSV